MVFDVAIVGGGMVGSACAIGLAERGVSVALIERNQPKEFDAEQMPDLRVSAINLNSENLMQTLGAWKHIQKMRLCPYKRLSVWEDKQSRTDFDCSSLGESHLGHIIENRIIQLGLHQTFVEHANLQCWWNDKIDSIELTPNPIITLESQQQIQAKLIIAADGSNSLLRQKASIGVQGWQYAQQALGINIKTTAVQQDITWQQFTPSGPLAYLPLYDGFGALVWYASAAKISALKKLSKVQLKQQIEQYFPSELLEFEVLEFASFPLTRMHANQYYNNNVVLVGDSAHCINPLAGQGVNLGFKDVKTLLALYDSYIDAKGELFGKGFEDVSWLREYEKVRRRDNLLMMSAMDALYCCFGNEIKPLKFLRNLGLKVANHAGPLKQKAMQYAMGF